MSGRQVRTRPSAPHCETVPAQPEGEHAPPLQCWVVSQWASVSQPEPSVFQTCTATPGPQRATPTLQREFGGQEGRSRQSFGLLPPSEPQEYTNASATPCARMTGRCIHLSPPDPGFQLKTSGLPAVPVKRQLTLRRAAPQRSL